MGAGRGIGGILQGLAQGYLEAKEEDKIKKTQEKETAKLQKRETIQRMLETPGLREEAKVPLFAFLAGDTKAEKTIQEMMLTGVVPGTEIETITPGGSPTGGPAAVLNAEGKLDASSPQNTAIGAADRGAPIGLQLPPDDSFAELDPIKTLSPRKSLFRGADEDAATDADLRATLAAEDRENEALLEEQRISRRKAQMATVIEAKGMDEDDPMRVAMLAALDLYGIGQEDQMQQLLTFEANPGMGLTEIGEVMDGFDLSTTPNSKLFPILEETNPAAYASLGTNAKKTLAAMANQRRGNQARDIASQKAKTDLDNRREKNDVLSAQYKRMMEAGMGEMEVKDANTHVRGLYGLEEKYLNRISTLTLAQEKVDTITQEGISEQAFKAIQTEKDILDWQADDIRNQINRWEGKIARVLGDDDGSREEITEIATDLDGIPNVQRVAANVTTGGTGTPIRDPETGDPLDGIPNDDPRKRQALIKAFSQLTEGAEFTRLVELKFSDDPMLKISEETMQTIRKFTAKLRDKPGRSIF